MIIGIDGNEANVKGRVGISEYAFRLLHEFYSFRPGGIKFIIYLKNPPLEDLPAKSDFWQYHIVWPSTLWTQIGLPFDLFVHRPRPSVFFSPTHYAPRFSPVPTIISVMDLSYIHFPDLFNGADLWQLRNWTQYSVKQAKKIFTISKASKNDIINEYHVAEERVVVTYPGVKQVTGLKPELYAMKQLQDKYNLSEHYILFVGTIQPRKNIERLIEAFAKTLNQAEQNSEPRTIKDLQLLIVGKKGWLYEEILKAPEKFGVENSVKFLQFVSEEELHQLYNHALFFILPSLYEGFGLPVLEAMKYECPVITSKVSSLPEVAGDAALYIDPEDTNDIMQKMKKLLNDKKLRNELIEKGRKQVQKFSWEKTARETLKVLEEVANQ